MNKLKICVYAITKNEEKFVERWVSSMSEADLIVVLDTGSKDNTVELLKSLGVIVYQKKIEPWRFDKARNLSLSYVPSDVDVCLCTDLDEVLNKGWRNSVEKYWAKNTTMGNYLYNWSINKDGKPDVQFLYNKMHTKKDYYWKYPVHEVLACKNIKSQSIASIEDMVLTHFPDDKKSRSNYIDLLKIGVEENSQDDRMSYYLGREYKFNKKWQLCIDTLKGYLDLPLATWNYEMSAAMRDIAFSYFNLNDYSSCKSWYLRAIAEASDLRDAYVELAQTAYFFKDWLVCFAFCENALLIEKRNLDYISQGYAWDHTPYDLSAISAYYLGYFEISKLRAKQAIQKSPNIARLHENLKLIERKNIT